jgi:hypothetical protein
LHCESEKTSTFNFNNETSKCLAIGEQQDINFWNDLNSLDRRGQLDTSVSKKHCDRGSTTGCGDAKDDGIDVVVSIFDSIIGEQLDFSCLLTSFFLTTFFSWICLLLLCFHSFSSF